MELLTDFQVDLFVLLQVSSGSEGGGSAPVRVLQRFGARRRHEEQEEEEEAEPGGGGGRRRRPSLEFCFWDRWWPVTVQLTVKLCMSEPI